MRRFTVSAPDDGEKLDRLIQRASDVSRRLGRTWISRGMVRVDGRVVRILTKPMRAGSLIEIDEEPTAGEERQGRAVPAEPKVLYRDASIIVVAKPAGLLSESDREGSASLCTVVPRLLADAGERRTGVWLVHRLDAGTSGVIVLARSVPACRALGAVFREGQAHKRYLALCAGRFEADRVVDAPIGRASGVKHQVRADGKPAVTKLTSLRATGRASLVAAEPKTGRTHQIRVHMAHCGHPLLGDRLYGGPGYTDGTPPQAIGRPMLHAESLTVPHPASGKLVTFTAEPPPDFVALARAMGCWRD